MKAPKGLSEASKNLWYDVIDQQASWSSSRLAVLEAGLMARDRMMQARTVLDAEGLTIRTGSSNMRRPHPLLQVESTARREFLAAWRALALNWAPNVDRR